MKNKTVHRLRPMLGIIPIVPFIASAVLPVTFVNGDQSGARVQPNGQKSVYRNGALIATRDASAWTFAASGGYIGLWVDSAPATLLDDFGGG